MRTALTIGGRASGKTDMRNRRSPGRYWGLRYRGDEVHLLQGNRIEARYPEAHARKAHYHCKVMMRLPLFPEHPR